MKNKSHLIYLILISVLLSVVVGQFVSMNTSKMAYVNLAEVFDQFNLKKELAEKMKKSSLAREELLTNLQIELENFAKSLNSETTEQELLSFRKKEALFQEKQQEFSRQESEQLRAYDEQIIKQMNQYIKEHGS